MPGAPAKAPGSWGSNQACLPHPSTRPLLLRQEPRALHSSTALGCWRSPAQGLHSCVTSALCLLVPRRSPGRREEPKPPGLPALLIELECSCLDGFLLGMAKQATYSAATGRGRTRRVTGDSAAAADARPPAPRGRLCEEGAILRASNPTWLGGGLITADHSGVPSRIPVLSLLLPRRLSGSACRPWSRQPVPLQDLVRIWEGAPGGLLWSLNISCLREVHRLGGNLHQKRLLFAFKLDPRCLRIGSLG